MRQPAGKRDRRIRRWVGGVVDSGLSDKLAWSPGPYLWASKEDVSDVERIRAQQSGALLTTRWVIVWDSSVANFSVNDKIEYPADSGAFYSVTGVKELGRRDELEISTSFDNP